MALSAIYIGRYRHPQQNPQEIVGRFAAILKDLPPGHWAVTGGLAGQELTQYLAPDTVTVLLDQKAREVIAKEPMLKDDLNGNITLLDLFAPNAIGLNTTHWPVTTPLLAFAELLCDGRPREIETASMIFEQYIQPEV